MFYINRYANKCVAKCYILAEKETSWPYFGVKLSYASIILAKRKEKVAYG